MLSELVDRTVHCVQCGCNAHEAIARGCVKATAGGMHVRSRHLFSAAREVLLTALRPS